MDGAVEVGEDEDEDGEGDGGETEVFGPPAVRTRDVRPMEKENVAPVEQMQPPRVQQQVQVQNPPAQLAPRTQITFAVPEANTSNPLLSASPIIEKSGDKDKDKQKGKSLGRKAGEALFQTITNVLSDSDSNSGSNPGSRASILPPRASSSLGLYKIFSGGANGSTASVGKAVSSGDKEKLGVTTTTTINRSRSHSASIFHRPNDESADPARTNRYADPNMRARPESMIDTSAVMVYPPGSTPESSPARGGDAPDPFRVDARTYYTPDVGVPNSPPPVKQANGTNLGHGRSASVQSSIRSGSTSARSTSSKSLSFQSTTTSTSTSARSDSDELVLALRTQLTFHQELSAQYEADLSARDELVSVLSSQLSVTKSELDARTRIARAARTKVGQLERACRGLERACMEMEEELERSRVESMERSVMDEASGEALRRMHGSIRALEKENERLKTEVEAGGNQRERSMNPNGSGSVGVNETGMSADEALNDRLRELQEERAAQEEKHREAELAWEEERGRLCARVEELVGVKTVLEKREGELEGWKGEVEAQWAGTEKMGEEMKGVKGELEDVRKERDELRKRIGEVEEVCFLCKRRLWVFGLHGVCSCRLRSLTRTGRSSISGWNLRMRRRA
jgi:hypothetical protein